MYKMYKRTVCIVLMMSKVWTHYKVARLLANLGWIDFDLVVSTVCLVLPRLMET